MFFHHFNILCFAVLFLTAVLASPGNSDENKTNFEKALEYARDVVGYASTYCISQAVYKCRNHLGAAVKNSKWGDLGSCLKAEVGSHDGLCYLG